MRHQVMKPSLNLITFHVFVNKANTLLNQNNEFSAENGVRALIEGQARTGVARYEWIYRKLWLSKEEYLQRLQKR